MCLRTGDAAIDDKYLEISFVCALRKSDIKLNVCEHRSREIESDIFKGLPLGLFDRQGKDSLTRNCRL